MSLVKKIKRASQSRLGPLIADRQPRRVDLPLSQWGLSLSEDGTVTGEGVGIQALTAQFGSPLHVVCGSALAANIDEAIAPSLAGTGADIFYSYKTNPIPDVLGRIHKGGIGAEVISAYEFWLARELGVPAERIIYNGPAKSIDSMLEAIRSNTFLINANSVMDYELIARLAATVGKKANLGIRAALPGMWAGQFGIGSSSPAVMETIRRAQESSHVNLRALHVHRGVTMRHLTDVQAHVRGVLQFVDRVRAEAGWHPEILDLGGSLACPSTGSISTLEYRLNRALATDTIPPDPADCVTVGEAASEAHRMVAEHFSALGLPSPQVILEPGRALTANTQFLLTTVLDVKRDSAVPHVIVDAGVNVAESVTTEYHQLICLSSIHQSATTAYRIAGPICTPADVLYNNWRMPDPEVEHVFAIMDTGAYCVPFSTSFSFPRPAIALIENGQATLLRRAETFGDIVSRDQGFATVAGQRHLSAER